MAQSNQNQTRKKNLFTNSFILATYALIISSIGWTVYSGNQIPELSQIAKPLLEIKLRQPELANRSHSYQWITNNEILISSRNPRKANTEIHHSYVLDRANRKWQESRIPEQILPVGSHLSRNTPDGKHLLWSNQYYKGETWHAPVVLVGRQGKTTRIAEQSLNSYTFLDNRTLGEFNRRNQELNLYDFDGNKLNTLPLRDALNEFTQPHYFYFVAQRMQGKLLLGNGNTVVFFNPEGTAGPEWKRNGYLQLLQVDIRNSKPEHKLLHIKSPLTERGVGRALVAPQGDRILWMTCVAQKHPLSNLTDQINKEAIKPSNFVSIWVSNIDGTNLKEIARVNRKPQPESSDPLNSLVFHSESLLPSIEWRPDGKAITYLKDNTIYTVPLP